LRRYRLLGPGPADYQRCAAGREDGQHDGAAHLLESAAHGPIGSPLRCAQTPVRLVRMPAVRLGVFPQPAPPPVCSRRSVSSPVRATDTTRRDPAFAGAALRTAVFERPRHSAKSVLRRRMAQCGQSVLARSLREEMAKLPPIGSPVFQSIGDASSLDSDPSRVAVVPSLHLNGDADLRALEEYRSAQERAAISTLNFGVRHIGH
jgi:hypothetical protein